MTDLEMILDPRTRDLGGFSVGRVLPAPTRKLVGPFVFFDHMGPADLAPGRGIDVRPHPHLHLATVTYLFAGEMTHRDSLGSQQVITPGAVNWMNAGRGIVHSERTPPVLRETGSALHGVQLWVALPTAHEDSEPAFDHYPAATLPVSELDGVRLHVLAGSAFGASSPVRTYSRLFYVDARMPAGSSLALPTDYEERAAYVVEGEVSCGEQRVSEKHMLVFARDSKPVLRAHSDARLMLLGGDALDGPRYLFWNFVSSSLERLERAKLDWKEGRFPKVPGDENEFIPLPENPKEKQPA